MALEPSARSHLFLPADLIVAAHQGVELLTTGRLSLPMQEPARTFLLDVRRGKVSEQACLERAGELEEQLTELASTSPLPPEPDDEQVQSWVLSAYRRRWGLGA